MSDSQSDKGPHMRDDTQQASPDQPPPGVTQVDARRIENIQLVLTMSSHFAKGLTEFYCGYGKMKADGVALHELVDGTPAELFKSALESLKEGACLAVSLYLKARNG